MVSLVPVRRACRGTPTIARFDVWRNGAHAVYLDDGRIRIESVAGRRGQRPWSRHPAIAGRAESGD